MRKTKQARFMEVCGTHTFAISKFALKHFYTQKIDFLSGPGCPVCVTSQEDIDYVIELAKNNNNIIVSFGDMMRVPSSDNSVSLDKLNQNNIKTVYSVLDILSIAVKNPGKNVIFLAVGFETTAPLIAGIILDAKKRKIKNFYIFSMLKTIVPALDLLLLKKQIKVDGFILPGHVCTVIGYKPFEFIVKKYKIPCIVAGFEFDNLKKAIDLLHGLYVNKEVKLLNCYSSAVKENGNTKALKTVYDVFTVNNVKWRGLGDIDNSGLKLNQKYSGFDVLNKFPKKSAVSKKNISKCICGKLFVGKYKPNQCPSFAKECTPLTPVGPCMVSSEGVCASYYKYGEINAK